jgi:hypothetical protein
LEDLLLWSVHDSSSSGADKKEGAESVSSSFWGHPKISVDEVLPLLVDLGFDPRICEDVFQANGGRTVDEAIRWLVNFFPPKELFDPKVEGAPEMILASKSLIHSQKETPSMEKITFRFKAPAVRACIIDDFEGRDMPLLEFRMDMVETNIQLTFTGKLDKAGGSCNAVISADYFNSKLSAWEPFVEKWPLLLSGEESMVPTMSLNMTQSRDLSSTLLQPSLPTSRQPCRRGQRGFLKTNRCWSEISLSLTG